MTGAPAISVVVAVEGRAALVARLLESLSQASAEYAGWSEVVVVDSSSEPERSLVRASCERADARHLVGSRNVREKRNLGASAAAGSHLLFVDSDCVVAPDLLALHVAAWSRSELVPDGARIVGAVGVTQFVGRQTVATMAAERSPFTLAFSAAQHAPFVPWATMSNTSIDRAAFLEAGGFAADLPGRLGGDDTDLTWRLTRSGQLLASAPDAVVEHDRRTWSRPRDVLGRVWRWGRMTHHLERRHSADLITVLPSAASVGLLTGLVVACLHVAGVSVAAVVPAAAAGLVVLSTARRLRESGPWGVSSSLLEGVFVAGLWCEGLRRGRPASPIRRLHLALPAPLPDRELEHLARRQVWDGWALAVAALTVLAWA